MTAQSRIQIACGKGGVGKTTLSLALAMRYASAGRKVVVVTSHPLPELAVSVSLEGLAERSPIAARNLFVVHLDPRALLAEIVEANFPVPMLARAVLQSDIYIRLNDIEKKLIQNESSIYAIQQYIEAKGAESNYQGAFQDCMAFCHDINLDLIKKSLSVQ